MSQSSPDYSWAPHLEQAQTGFSDPWVVALPRVFRYMDEAYVDAFIEHGRLRLPSVAVFASHDDEIERRDNEGASVNAGRLLREDGSYGEQILTYSVVGTHAYMLCGSVLEDPKLLTTFKASSCLVIDRPLEFAGLIRRHIPGFVHGMQGHCVYSPRGRSIRRLIGPEHGPLIAKAIEEHGFADITAPIEEQNRITDGQPTPTQMAINRLVTGDEQMLIKSAAFNHQAEYRFVWETSKQAQAYLEIECPEAVPLCRKVSFASPD